MGCRSCMLEGTRRRHNCFAQQQDRLDLVGVRHVEGHVLRANLRIALQTFDDSLGRANQVKRRAVTLLFRGELTLVSRNQDRDIIRTGNLVVWSAHTLAVLAQHGVPVRNPLRVAADIAEVGVLCDEPECDLLAAAPDHDWRPRLLHRWRVIVGSRNSKVLAAEACRALRHHAVDNLDRLLKHLHALTHRRKRPAVGQELLVVPGRPEANDAATMRDDIERREHLGQQRRVAIRHPNHQLAERMRDVLAAIAPRATKQSKTGTSLSGSSSSGNMKWAASQTESSPACSQARAAASVVSQWLPCVLGAYVPSCCPMSMSCSCPE